VILSGKWVNAWTTSGCVYPSTCAGLARAVAFKATEQPIGTGTAAGKCFLDMLGVFAEFETNLRRERQLEGIARAKAQGVYRGRPGSIDAAKVRAMKAEGKGGN
jgi:DNA invertase Pin-like site-specific DNA recombinase